MSCILTSTFCVEDQGEVSRRPRLFFVDWTPLTHATSSKLLIYVVGILI